MIYGEISANKRINKAIYDCFDYLQEKEQKKFVKKFHDQPHANIQIMHTFRELILGAYLSKSGFIVENDRNLCKKTPDWSICDLAGNVTCAIEMVYHHIDNKTNSEIVRQYKEGKKVFAYFPNVNDPDNYRLYSQIQIKASKYKYIINKLAIPYIVAIFIDFTLDIDISEMKTCLSTGNDPIFEHYKGLSGVLKFEEGNFEAYNFSYISNPNAEYKFSIPSGIININN